VPCDMWIYFSKFCMASIKVYDNISVILNDHLVCLVHMARNTRSGHNEVPSPPPPPPPTPAELLATLVEGQPMLNEAMQTMAQ